MKRARQWFAFRIWSVAEWVYPYARHDPDTAERRAWSASVSFTATEAVADEFFEQLTDMSCGREHHALEPCNFEIGSMGPAEVAS